MYLRRTAIQNIVALSLSGAAVGCGSLNHFSDLSTSAAPLPQIVGRVHGGQQPVSGATIQLYAANSTTAKGASKALITPVTTGAGGQFTITTTNYCPTPSSLVYLVATGGNPGLAGTVNNADLALMAALGTCGQLGAQTDISVNELTTVAAVEALAPFMADETHIGADAGNPNGLAGAFAGAAAIVNFSTGQFVTPPSGVTQPTQLYNTLANILAVCVNSSGGTAGDGSVCGNLLKYAANGATMDTAQAILHIAQLPGQNVSQLFGLVNAMGPFQPALGTLPKDFTNATTIGLPLISSSEDHGFVIDTAQRIWVYTTPYAYNATLGYNVGTTGPGTVYDNNGNLLQTIAAGTGGYSLIFAGGADPFGNVFAFNETGTLSKFASDGSPLSSASGFPFPYTLPPGTVYEPGEGTIDTLLSIDPSGNVWGLGNGGTSGCYNEASNSGALITPSGNFCSAAGNNYLIEVATDGSGNAWFLGDHSIAKVNSSGAFVASGVDTNGCFTFPASGSVANQTADLIYDRANNQLWGIGEFQIGALHSDGSQVFCHANGSSLPTMQTSSSILGVYEGAVDGAGNLWFTTYGATYGSTGFTYFGGLNEMDPNGNLLTPFNPAAGVYGLQPAGLVNGRGVGVDSYGNVWVVDGTTHLLLKIPGVAVPKNHQ